MKNLISTTDKHNWFKQIFLKLLWSVMFAVPFYCVAGSGINNHSLSMNPSIIMASTKIQYDIPAGYKTVYVLTSGSGPVIEQAGLSPSFTVSGSGFITIHTRSRDSDVSGLESGFPWTITMAVFKRIFTQTGDADCAVPDTAGDHLMVGYSGPYDNSVFISLKCHDMSDPAHAKEKYLIIRPSGKHVITDGSQRNRVVSC